MELRLWGCKPLNMRLLLICRAGQAVPRCQNKNAE
jgi:hypothetical protein